MTEQAHDILVVDDNPINLKLVAFLMKASGYVVRTALNAEDAIVAIAERCPEMILMDVQLPGMDGLELAKRLKAAEETRDTIIVAVTAYAMRGDEERIKAAGCDGYITKPIDTRAFPIAIAEYFEKNRK